MLEAICTRCGATFNPHGNRFDPEGDVVGLTMDGETLFKHYGDEYVTDCDGIGAPVDTLKRLGLSYPDGRGDGFGRAPIYDGMTREKLEEIANTWTEREDVATFMDAVFTEMNDETNSKPRDDDAATFWMIPGTCIVSFKRDGDGDVFVDAMTWTPAAGDAGYFGPSMVERDYAGEPVPAWASILDVENVDGPAWHAVQVFLAGEAEGPTWTE